MNIDCDARAEEQNKEEPQSNPKIIPHSSIKTYFKSNRIINTGKLLQQIVKDQHGPKMEEFIKKKFKLTDVTDITRTIQAKKSNQQVRISKAMYN